MPEVGFGAALERFELLAHDQQQCVIDIVDGSHASIVLSQLPEFPLDIDPERAKQFVAAWRERHNIQGRPYAVEQEQREV